MCISLSKMALTIQAYNLHTIFILYICHENKIALVPFFIFFKKTLVFCYNNKAVMLTILNFYFIVFTN